MNIASTTRQVSGRTIYRPTFHAPAPVARLSRVVAHAAVRSSTSGRRARSTAYAVLTAADNRTPRFGASSATGRSCIGHRALHRRSRRCRTPKRASRRRSRAAVIVTYGCLPAVLDLPPAARRCAGASTLTLQRTTISGRTRTRSADHPNVYARCKPTRRLEAISRARIASSNIHLKRAPARRIVNRAPRRGSTAHRARAFAEQGPYAFRATSRTLRAPENAVVIEPVAIGALRRKVSPSMTAVLLLAAQPAAGALHRHIRGELRRRHAHRHVVTAFGRRSHRALLAHTRPYL